MVPWPAPAPREAHFLAFDSDRKRVVLHGGWYQAPMPDTWEYVGASFIAGSGTTRPGGRVDLSLTGSSGDAGRPYVVGSSLGTGPIPIGRRILRPSPDALLQASAGGFWPAVFVNYRGTLDARCRARAHIDIPSVGALAGVRIHSAFLVLNPSAPEGVNSVSTTFLFTIAAR